MMKNTIYKYLIIIILLTSFCSSSREESKIILATIGDRVITVDEFVNRSELTPRPFYCRSNTDEHKIIALNSIIAEKLFALEAGDNSEVLSKKMFQAYIKGKKEQYMREKLFKQIAREPVRLDESEINETFKLAGIVYDVEFYNLSKKFAEKFNEKLAEEPDSAASIFNSIDLTETVPKKTIEYRDPDHPLIHHSLYSKMSNPGEVIGPLKLQDNHYIVMKIAKVTYSPSMSQTETLDRKRFVKEKLLKYKSIIRWDNYISKVMKGKKIEFIPQTTVKMAELYSMKDLPNDRQEEMIMKKLGEDKTNLSLEDLSDKDDLMRAPFFKINDQIWTVAEFRELLLSHPLVFRDPDYSKDEYLEQFRLAVADLIRDHYLTKESYKKSIDKSEYVKRNIAMWQDSYVAKYHREKYLESLSQSDHFDQERMKGTYTYIDEYTDSLQGKYSHLIEINIDEFEKIQLTQTDMFSVQQFVPYPLPVPSFPQLCVDEMLDYGSGEGKRLPQGTKRKGKGRKGKELY
jgi:hypothetical protein